MRIFLLVLFFCVSLQAAYHVDPGLTIRFGHTALSFSHQPMTQDDIVYVPLMECAAQLGLLVEREGARIKVSRAADMRVVLFSTLSRTVKINDVTDELDSPIVVLQNTPFISLSEFVWLFGYFVERDRQTITLATKIKDIAFDNQTLTIKGQAPLQTTVAVVPQGYVLTITNCILGSDREEQEILIADGTIDRITPKQVSLSPAVVSIFIETKQKTPYTLLKEDTENGITLRFAYTPSIRAAHVAASPSEEPLTQSIIRKTIDAKILWLPEAQLAKQSTLRFVLKGTAYPPISVPYVQGKLLVPFDDVFGALGCTLTKKNGRWMITDPGNNTYQVDFVTGEMNAKPFVPLMQTLRLVGYAAYADADQVVHINPVISDISYDATQAKLTIKANDRLSPKVLQYLKTTAVLDIPCAAYNVTQNIFRTNAPSVTQVRVAQFAQGIVRIAMDIPSTQNKPVLSYENNGQWLTILFKATALRKVTVFADKRNNMRLQFVGGTTLNAYTVSQLKNPDRLLIDFQSTLLAMPNHLDVAQGPIARIRLSQFSLNPQTTRVVLDLKPDYRAYSISKEGSLFVYGAMHDKQGAVKAIPTIIVTKPITTKTTKPKKPGNNKQPLPATAKQPTADYVAQAYDFVEKVVPVVREAVNDTADKPAVVTKSVAVAKASQQSTTVQQPISLRGLRVAIIPGHGGADAGAISRSGYMEKLPTLEVGKYLQAYLAEAGAIPLICRERDENVTLEQQAEFANRNKADILISIHFNSFMDSSVGGAEAYYYKPIDYALAKLVHEEILKIEHVRNKGLKKACMHNLNHTTMPGVLVEPLFISNRQEETMIKDSTYQQALAKAIVRGIVVYTKKKG